MVLAVYTQYIMRLPSEIEKKILDLLSISDLTWQTKSSHKKRLHELRKQMYKLSDDFAQTKSSAEKYPDAYFAYNFPMNFMKAMMIAQRVKSLYPQLTNHKSTLRILDIGCGEGAGMFGLYYGFRSSKRFLLTGIDRSTKMIKRSRGIGDWLQKCDSDMRIKLHRRKVPQRFMSKKAQKYDIVIFANSLAEILPETDIPLRFIERIFQGIDDSGIIIIIEPALKNMSRRLMSLRKEIIQKKKGYILLPCLHESGCPLQEIRQQREWCHQSIPWNPPEFMQIINQGLDREIDTLKFSYLIIAYKKTRRLSEDGFLVISPLLKEKGKKKCYLCTSRGRSELIRLNKEQTTLNNAFDTIRKGDIIVLEKCIQKKSNYWQITDTTCIEIIYSSS